MVGDLKNNIPEVSQPCGMAISYIMHLFWITLPTRKLGAISKRDNRIAGTYAGNIVGRHRSNNADAAPHDLRGARAFAFNYLVYSIAHPINIQGHNNNWKKRHLAETKIVELLKRKNFWSHRFGHGGHV